MSLLIIFLYLLIKVRFVILLNDNTIYEYFEDLSAISENLKHNMKVILTWFNINSLQANPGKIKFMILGKRKFKLIVNSTEIEEITKEVLLGILFDNLLTLN